VIKFSYIHKNELCIHGESHTGSRESSVDFSAASGSSALSRLNSTGENDDHVLVLEFAADLKGKKQRSNG
jgi:hypothetical protein